MATFRPSTEAWRPLVKRFAGDIPVDFVMAWIDGESHGLECAVGIPGREAGIFQTMHPGDDQHGATFSQLRVNCIGGTQERFRPLTEEERILQMSVGIRKVQAKLQRARTILAQHGVRWPESSIDFWNFVKLGHGLPAIQSDLLPRIIARLGRPPANWDEFAREVMATPVSGMPNALVPFAQAPSLRGRQNRIADVLANAESSGKFGGGLLANIRANPILAGAMFMGAGGVLLYILVKRSRA